MASNRPLPLWLALASVGFVYFAGIFSSEALEPVRLFIISLPPVKAVLVFISVNAAVAAVFGASVYAAYKFGFHRREAAPTFVLDNILLYPKQGAQYWYLRVRNTGDSSDAHLVKVLSLRNLHTGYSSIPGYQFPVALKNESNEGRIFLASGEHRNLLLGGISYAGREVVFEFDGQRPKLALQPGVSLVMSLALYRSRPAFYDIRFDMSHLMVRITVLSPRESRRVRREWAYLERLAPIIDASGPS
jgi:hypothetical protein